MSFRSSTLSLSESTGHRKDGGSPGKERGKYGIIWESKGKMVNEGRWVGELETERLVLQADKEIDKDILLTVWEHVLRKCGNGDVNLEGRYLLSIVLGLDL